MSFSYKFKIRIDSYSDSLNKMPRKQTSSATRCLLCNSLSHTLSYCNSNMKGQRTVLEDMKDCMMADKMPDFNSFPINELRFIVIQYECSIAYTLFPQRLFVRPQIKYLHSHISLTLPKKRVVRELVNRWNLYASVRTERKNPCEEEDCPICMDCMSMPTWNHRLLRWDNIVAKQPPDDAMFPNNIKTQCGHTFCGSCWEQHYKTNRKMDYSRDEMYLSCPMCRHRMYL